MRQVGLTGGIGSGKSTVSGLLERLGAVVIDADVVARDVVAPGSPGLAAVVAEFGPGVVSPNGALDRARLAEIVFTDPQRRRALNAIVHPLVGRRTAELVTAVAPDAVVVHDVPLLAENGLAAAYDLVVVVDVPSYVQVERLTQLRGMAEDDARARIAAQATRSERLAVADVVLDNSGSPEHLERQVRDLWTRLASAEGAR